MALTIQTTGLEQYAPGGNARVKVLVIGGPGAGKTRWASYFPKPIYADVEAGLASVADRKVPFTSIRNSQDMLDLLEYLKQEQRQPWEQRQYQTIVIDTLDAFQRKVKNEWMEKENKQVFTGWDAWGFLNAKMGLLMTRLLNLDMNVIVNVHYKDKTIKDDETGRESREIVLQLQGEMSDTAFNDFDLVGWMGTYWEAVDGQKVEKRGLTFKRTADKPFLKDRLYVTPTWMEVKFDDSDYSNLFSKITERMEGLDSSEEVGEVPTTSEEAVPGAGVVSPAQAGSGPVPPQQPSQGRLADFDKPTLQQEARKRGIPFKANTLKGELIVLIEQHDAQPKVDPPSRAADAPAKDEDALDVKPAPPEDAVTEPVTVKEPEKSIAASEALQRFAERAKPTVQTELGTVDTSTGEVIEPADTVNPPAPTPPTEAEAVATVEKTLGGQVIAEEKTEPEPPAPTPTAAAPRGAVQGDCDDCGKDLSTERPDVVKLSRIKFKAPKPNPVTTGLCADCYSARKLAG